jgi:hypothetical protein
MTLRRLGILQWLGLLLGALVFAAQLVVGYGITEAECNPGGHGFGISNDLWQGVLLGASAALVVGAEVAAIAVVLGTRRFTYEVGPPPGRLRFFGIAAMAANLIFLAIILLGGIAAIVGVDCRQG